MTDTLLGTRVGHYRIVDLIAKGGMGEVYVGYDEKLDRKVALKSIRPEYQLHDQARVRFQREARVLSQLGHPNICQIYDYIEGEPSDFLVLELISGKSLTAVMKKGLNFDLKMRIAEQIAAVLIAAHDKGVIHRDLKPDNVMLTEGDQVKVLDFGLSRLRIDEVTETLAPPPGEEVPRLKPPGSEPAAAQPTPGDHAAAEPPGRAVLSPANLTAMGTVVGTLGYMSPEQARGDVAWTASDLYSFGVLLQELFTGKAAFDKGVDPAAMLQNAIAGETLPVEGIDADLAALIARLKSLSPAARPSAVDTAERLAWIRQKPVRKRKKILVAAAMVVLALFGGAMTILAIRATRAERAATAAEKAAKQEAETSKQVSDFLVSIFQVVEPSESKGNTITAREILDQGAQKIETELKDQPIMQARLMDTMGRAYGSLGLYSKAETLIEKALRIRENSVGPNDADTSESLHSLAELYRGLGKFEKAEPLYKRALAIREAVSGPEDASTAICVDNLAQLYVSWGDYAKAEPLHKRALAIWEKTLGPDHPNTATCLNNLANLYFSQGRYADAEPLYKRALAIAEKVLGQESLETATDLNNLAFLYDKEGRYAEAEPLFKRALGIREKIEGPDHPNTAVCLNNLGNLYQSQGKYAEAEPLYKRALAIWEKALGPDHPNTATGLSNLAGVYQEEGKFAEAEPLFKRSIAIQEKVLGPDHPNTSVSVNNLASLYYKQGKYAEAEPLYRRSLSIREKALGPDHPLVASALRNLANLYKNQSKYAEAEPLYQRSLKIYERALGPEHPDVARVLYYLGCLSARQGKRAEALAFLRRALPAGGKMPWMRSIGKEPDLASLHGDPEFERIVAEVK